MEAIEAPALSGLSVESFAINPDGVHVAMVARKNNKLIAGIALLSRGNTTQLTDWKELSFDLSASKPEDITDVAWQSDLRMVLLGKAESSTQVFAYFSELNSQTVTSGARPTEWMAKSVISSGYGPNNVVYILSFDGTVWRHVNGRTFTKYIEGVQSLALPGQ